LAELDNSAMVESSGVGGFRFGGGPGCRIGQNPVPDQLAPDASARISPDRLQQHRVPVKVEELLLAAGEPSDIDDLGHVDAHSLKEGPVNDWREYVLAVVLEADEATIKEMIYAGR